MEPQHAAHKKPEPWHRRAIGAFLGLGALAGAFVAIVQARDVVIAPEPDVEKVTITDIEQKRLATLAEFVGVHPGRDVSLSPAPVSAGDVVGQRVIAAVRASSTATRDAAPATQHPSATASGEESTTSGTGGTESSSTGPGPTPSSTEGVAEAVARAVRQHPGLGQYDLGQWDTPPLAPPWDEDNVVVDHVESAPGSPQPSVTVVTPEDEAERLWQALQTVETRTTDGKKEPLGYVISVDFTVEGYKDEALLLTWTLDENDSTWDWSVETLAYRLTATTNDDRGSVEVWVPDLVQPGPYTVNVTIRLPGEKDPVADDGYVIPEQ
ncbi:hypothetical protein GXP71_00075 [Cellulomonas sp. H30R-01]|uniref:hypothetical protein n=1 Tax=Cellulomonas sp. H30R-01 TaxID=2704467 RepID=UPI00138B81E0|nr:hypothetical protein [Cellulomonas sp. H30R-01]QHT54652.1 hypothetical protein GXP71_00075 [Cellulomonas sp. H30R-01]